MLGLLTALALMGSDQGDTADTLKVIANAYASNFEAIRRGKLVVIVTEGTAANAAAARNGDIQGQVQSTINYMFTNKNKIYTHLYKDDDVIRGTKLIAPMTTSTRFNPIRMATNGTNLLIDLINLPPDSTVLKHRPVIQADNGLFQRRYGMPMNFGFMRRNMHNLEMDLESARLAPEASRILRFRDGEPFEGRKVFEIALRAPNGDRVYWVDSEKGCLPLQILDKSKEGAPVLQINYEHIKEIDKNIWSPMAVNMYMHQSKRAWRYQIKEFKLDFPDELSETKFEFPTPVAVVDTVNSLRHAETTSFSLSNIIAPSRRQSTPIKIEASSPPPKLPGERERSNQWMRYLLGVVSASLVLFVFYRIRRSRVERNGSSAKHS